MFLSHRVDLLNFLWLFLQIPQMEIISIPDFWVFINQLLIFKVSGQSCWLILEDLQPSDCGLPNKNK